MWLGQATFAPPLDAVARQTITWTKEGEAKLARVPESVRAMVTMAILRFAQESGHTVITASLIDEATARLCPHSSGRSAPAAEPRWSGEAGALLESVDGAAGAAGIRLRAEKRARRRGGEIVEADDVRPFLDAGAAAPPLWTAAALARLARVPPMVRDALRCRAEALARHRSANEVSPGLLEDAIAQSRQVMAQAMQAGGHKRDGIEGVLGGGELDR